MAFIITEDCNLCDACVEECPNEAITEGDDIYTIDALKCTECVGYFDEAQCAEVCPMECCLTDPDNVEDESVLLDKAKRLAPAEDFDEDDLPSHFRA
ncbi:MAG: YfhL family 4Fe-4S dicluster ferredoxin [Gammaproteobacteria bacterium]|nr:YfhL family 4Fe-4S dicluster ferredoxin [Gammaproteobacteria bacterium]